MPLFSPLEKLQQADLPPRTKSFWQMAGPGAVLVGLSIGAGEIIIWPTTIAKHGAGMAWAAVVGVFMQIWINFEVARWTVATGETVYTGYARVWRGFGPVFILLTILGWLAPGWAQASGSALKALLVGPDFGAQSFWGSNTCWTTAGWPTSLAYGGPHESIYCLCFRWCGHWLRSHWLQPCGCAMGLGHWFWYRCPH